MHIDVKWTNIMHERVKRYLLKLNFVLVQVFFYGTMILEY